MNKLSDEKLHTMLNDNDYVHPDDYDDYFSSARPGVLSTKSFARMKEQKDIVPITDARA